MYSGPGVKTSPDFPIPDTMKAWVLGNPGELKLAQKPVPVPKRAEVLVRIDAVAICATDLEIIDHGPPASILGGMPFNKNFTPGHEYMGTVVALGPGVDEYRIGQRITVEIHAGCGQCKRCREGMYTSCHNYGLNYGDVDKGHRANGFTTDGGFCEYQVNNINTLVAIPDAMSDEEATLVVTAGTAMYGLTELGGLVAGESVVVTGPGPIGLLGVAVAKALGASPVILTGTRDNRLKIGRELGADHVVNVRNEDAVEAVRRLNGGKGVDYVIECSGAPNAVNDAIRMVNRGGKVCLAAFPHQETPVDVAHIVRNNIYLYGIRGEGKSATHRAEAFMSQKRFDATKIHTHTFPLDDLPTAIRYAKDRVDDAIKVVVKAKGVGRASGRRRMRTYVALTCAAVTASFFSSAAPAAAEDWPTHPVRIVNTFAPGGAADILARMAADQLTKAFGQQFYVETRAGAGGVIGVDFVAHSDPDGYNFVITTLSLTAINPLINAKIGYDPFKDLTHVAYLAGSPIVFIVSAKSDIKTLKDFVAKAKASAQAADLRRVRTGERRTDDRGILRADRRSQIPGGALQGRRAKPARRGGRQYRFCHADGDLGVVAAPRRHRDRAGANRQRAAAGLSRTCRPSRSLATSSKRPTGSASPVRPDFPPISSARSTP